MPPGDGVSRRIFLLFCTMMSTIENVVFETGIHLRIPRRMRPNW